MTLADPVSTVVPQWGRAPAGAAGTHPAGPVGTRPRTRTDVPAPTHRQHLEAMARGFVALFLEVEAGRRPRGHLAGLMTPMLYARLGPVWVRRGPVGSVLCARIAAIGPDAVDVVAIVRRGARCGAVGLRLLKSQTGWVVDDVAMPEHGPLPLPAYPVPAETCEEPDDLALIPRPELALPADPGQCPDWFASARPG